MVSLRFIAIFLFAFISMSYFAECAYKRSANDMFRQKRADNHGFDNVFKMFKRGDGCLEGDVCCEDQNESGCCECEGTCEQEWC